MGLFYISQPREEEEVSAPVYPTTIVAFANDLREEREETIHPSIQPSHRAAQGQMRRRDTGYCGLRARSLKCEARGRTRIFAHFKQGAKLGSEVAATVISAACDIYRK